MRPAREVTIRVHSHVAAAMWQTQDTLITLTVNGRPIGNYKIDLVTWHGPDDADVRMVQMFP